MSSAGMPPGRSSCGGSVVQSTIVDSTPIGRRPAVEHDVARRVEVGAEVVDDVARPSSG